MTISDFQISSVVKTYMRNMKSRVGESFDEKVSHETVPEDKVMISEEGMKRILFERIGEKMTERLTKRYEQQD